MKRGILIRQYSKFSLRGKKVRPALTLLFSALLFVCALLSMLPKAGVFASEEKMTEEEAKNQISDAVDEQLKSIDFSALEEQISELNQDGKKIFGGDGFLSKVKSIINGDFAADYPNIFAAIAALVFSEIVAAVPYLATVVGVVALCSMLNGIRSKQSDGNTVYLACYGTVILITAAVVMLLVRITKDTVDSMQTQMNIVFPILLAALTALGGAASAAVYQPMVSVLSQVVSNILSKIILPLFIFGFVFNIAGNLSQKIKLKKFSDFTSSLSKWIIGIVFTVFSAFMAIQGATAASFDGVSVKTARYAISHYIPIIGGYLSDGFNLVLAGSVLVKNAVGMTALLLLFASIIVPILKIIVMMLALKFTAAIAEPIDSGGFSDFLSGAAKNITMLIAIILGVAFMYFISVLLMIGTGNMLI